MKKKTLFISILLAFLLMFSVSMAVAAAPVNDYTENAGAGISAVQGEIPHEPKAPDGIESKTEAAPATSKNNNTPFFVGAGIAVLMFAGVALYCNKNGNKTL